MKNIRNSLILVQSKKVQNMENNMTHSDKIDVCPLSSQVSEDVDLNCQCAPKDTLGKYENMVRPCRLLLTQINSEKKFETTKESSCISSLSYSNAREKCNLPNPIVSMPTITNSLNNGNCDKMNSKQEVKKFTVSQFNPNNKPKFTDSTPQENESAVFSTTTKETHSNTVLCTTDVTPAIHAECKYDMKRENVSLDLGLKSSSEKCIDSPDYEDVVVDLVLKWFLSFMQNDVDESNNLKTSKVIKKESLSEVKSNMPPVPLASINKMPSQKNVCKRPSTQELSKKPKRKRLLKSNNEDVKITCVSDSPVKEILTVPVSIENDGCDCIELPVSIQDDDCAILYYTCIQCLANFQNTNDLFYHTCSGKRKHGFLCDICELIFESIELVEEHRMFHFDFLQK